MFRGSNWHHGLAFLALASVLVGFGRDKLRARQERHGTRHHKGDYDAPENKLGRAVKSPRVSQIRHRRRNNSCHGLQEAQHAQQLTRLELRNCLSHVGLGRCKAGHAQRCHDPSKSKEDADRSKSVANIPDDI
ncbi:hypothetical protein MMC22_010201 [Lobaria immixta]|nr:hypothetical protein [Lobaria immixta]